MTMKVSQAQQARIEALPDDIKRQIVASYQGVFMQDVYHIPSGKVVSVWAMDLVRFKNYITTAQINEVTRYAFADKRNWNLPPHSVEKGTHR